MVLGIVSLFIFSLTGFEKENINWPRLCVGKSEKAMFRQIRLAWQFVTVTQGRHCQGAAFWHCRHFFSVRLWQVDIYNWTTSIPIKSCYYCAQDHLRWPGVPFSPVSYIEVDVPYFEWLWLLLKVTSLQSSTMCLSFNGLTCLTSTFYTVMATYTFPLFPVDFFWWKLSLRKGQDLYFMPVLKRGDCQGFFFFLFPMRTMQHKVTK